MVPFRYPNYYYWIIISDLLIIRQTLLLSIVQFHIS